MCSPWKRSTEPGVCGLERPLALSGLLAGVGVTPLRPSAAPSTAALDRWFNFGAAGGRSLLPQRVVRSRRSPSYSCRAKGNNFGQFSADAFGNALDIAGFRWRTARTSSWSTPGGVARLGTSVLAGVFA